jgi:hypothetical protein
MVAKTATATSAATVMAAAAMTTGEDDKDNG